jgi:exonuclease III
MDPSKFLIWNVRGLNPARKDTVCSLVDDARVDVVCLQETKMMNMSRFCVMRTLGLDFCIFFIRASNGASGRILVSWKSHVGFRDNGRVDDHGRVT